MKSLDADSSSIVLFHDYTPLFVGLIRVLNIMRRMRIYQNIHFPAGHDEISPSPVFGSVLENDL